MRVRLATAITFGLLLSAALPARGAEQLSPEVRKALEEGEAILRRAKAEGKLPDAPEKPASTVGPAAKAGPGCVRLKVGEAAVVSYPTDAESPTGSSAHYGLSRPMDDTFVAEVRLRFVRGEGYSGSLPEKELDGAYRGRMNKCLSEFAGVLRSERAGKKLVLRLTDNAAVPEHVVEVMAAGKRANWQQYPSDIRCPTMLHELLHVLGLPDEYKEVPKESGKVEEDCRVAGPEDSVMNDQWETMAAIDYGEGEAVPMCRCEKPGLPCFELSQKKLDGKACPTGSVKFLQPVDPDMKESANALNSKDAFVLSEVREKTGTKPPAHNSVLYPAHFRVITEPGCKDVNEAYYSCAVNAYRFSKNPGGLPAIVRAEDHGCRPKPSACSFGSKKWLE